jgi:hypothetical protein
MRRLTLTQHNLGCQLEVIGHYAGRLDLLGLEGDFRSIKDIYKSSSVLYRYSKIRYYSGTYKC